jgi:hypothetical protein
MLHNKRMQSARQGRAANVGAMTQLSGARHNANRQF